MKGLAKLAAIITFGVVVSFLPVPDGLSRDSWFADRITSAISSFSPNIIIVFLLLAFYLIHYLFASTTAHVAALLTLFFLTAKGIPGINFPLFTYLLLFSVGLMGILTPYATGPSPIWYGFGYIPSRTFWMLGAFFGFIFFIVLILVGIPWINLWV